MRPGAGALSVAHMPTTSHKLLVATLATAATATGAAALSGAAYSPAASTIDEPETLTFSEPFTGSDHHYKYVDLGKKGMSPGDVILHTRSPAIDDRTGRRLGTSDGIETILSLKHEGTVAVSDTVRLPGGRIEVAGTVRHGDRRQALAVIGGTGRFANVRGEVTITEDTEQKRNLITVTLLP
jgi:hypothetical protein